MNGAMAYRSLYFSNVLPLSALPLQIVEVNPLFFEVIERMAFWQWGMPEEQQSSLITVFCEVSGWTACAEANYPHVWGS